MNKWENRVVIKETREEVKKKIAKEHGIIDQLCYLGAEYMRMNRIRDNGKYRWVGLYRVKTVTN